VVGIYSDTPLVLTPQSDETWMANAQKLMDLTGETPLGLYETPVPKVRWVRCEVFV